MIESSASAAANKILDLLDVNTNKRWSGPEFFGFTKPDVARELMKDSEHFLPEHFNKRKKFMDDKNASTNQAIEVGNDWDTALDELELYCKFGNIHGLWELSRSFCGLFLNFECGIDYYMGAKKA